MESYRAFYHSNDRNRRNHGGGSDISTSENYSSTIGSGATLNHNAGGECSGNGGREFSMSGNNTSACDGGATLNHNAGGECSGNGRSDDSMSGNNNSASDDGVALNQNAGSECGEDGGTVIQGHLINKLKCVLTNLKFLPGRFTLAEVNC